MVARQALQLSLVPGVGTGVAQMSHQKFILQHQRGNNRGAHAAAFRRRLRSPEDGQIGHVKGIGQLALRYLGRAVRPRFIAHSGRNQVNGHGAGHLARVIAAHAISQHGHRPGLSQGLDTDRVFIVVALHTHIGTRNHAHRWPDTGGRRGFSG